MKTYLVGGAVRDKLLNLPLTDKDWVVVGATPEQMLRQGYIQVGRDFPVFLHPETRQEYALARTERKSGTGYTGFTCYADPDVTLEQDLSRRDLTINAIACDADGQYYDPYNGRADIEQRILRHVSAAFTEDPLRVLRVARFAARFAHLGFRVATDTLALMQAMARQGELNQLTAERVWKETESALLTHSPQVFFQVLRDCGALAVLFPELDHLYGIPTPETCYPQADSGVHALMALTMATQLSTELDVRFAALFQRLGDTRVPQEKAGIPLIKKLCERLRVPNTVRDLTLLVTEFRTLVHAIEQQPAAALVNLFDRLDAWRKPHRVEQLIVSCKSDVRGYSGFEHHDYPQGISLYRAFKIASAIPTQDIVTAGFKGAAIREELTRRRILALES